MELTHHDIKVGTWYITHGTLVYVHDRLIKGQTGNLSAAVPLPDGLDVVCGYNCGLLKKGTCNHKAPSIKAIFNGGQAPMVSYLVSTVDARPNKLDGTLWDVTTQQVTSRSISNVIYIDGLRESEWGSPALWEYENNVITALSDRLVNVMRQKPSKSEALEQVINANARRSTELFNGLLSKMARDDASTADAAWPHPDKFVNKGVFLTSVGGVTGNYNSYSAYPPRETALINSLVLKAARAKYPKDVERILDCYRKVEQAKAMEEKPFEYDLEHVAKLVKSKLRTKPTSKAEVAEIPF